MVTWSMSAALKTASSWMLFCRATVKISGLSFLAAITMLRFVKSSFIPAMMQDASLMPASISNFLSCPSPTMMLWSFIRIWRTFFGLVSMKTYSIPARFSATRSAFPIRPYPQTMYLPSFGIM